MADPAAPQNVCAIRRENYTLVWWDKVTKDVGGAPLGSPVIAYEIHSGSLIDEHNQVLRATVTTVDINSTCDTIYVDLNTDPTHAYRIRAIVAYTPVVIQSGYSDKVTAVQVLSQIDNKLELLDRNILVLGTGKLGEGLLV